MEVRAEVVLLKKERTDPEAKRALEQSLVLELAHGEDGVPTRMIHALETGERTVAEALGEAG